MIQKIRNLIIFIIIAALFVLIYIYFIKPKTPESNLVSTPASSSDVTGSQALPDGTDNSSSIAKDFLALLLSVKSIKLDDSIFSNPAFMSLHDSSITLIQDGTEGRPNPFAQFGNDNAAPSAAVTAAPAPAPSNP